MVMQALRYSSFRALRDAAEDQSKKESQQEAMQPRWYIGEKTTALSVVYPLSDQQFIHMNPAALCVISRVMAF